MRLTARQRWSWFAHLFKAATRQHHTELLPRLAAHIASDAVIVDAGAHAGQFAKLFAKMAPRGRVYAFEPAEYARSVMAPALRLAGLRNITVISAGLSDAPGELTLRTPVKPSGSLGFGTAHLGIHDGVSPTVDQTVTLVTLDDFAGARNLERLDFIKADIEGWELHALRGGESTLRRFMPALLLEVDDAFLMRAGDSADSLFDWLAQVGYRGFQVPSLIASPSYARVGDYLFLAKQQA
ncbi:MAG TPA: FkbM family methyltransferase [Caulobacteraceae bacterium]